MTSLAIYRTTRVCTFFPHFGSDDTLHGEPVRLPTGTPVALIRIGRDDPDRAFVQAGELYAWLWLTDFSA